MVAVLTRSVVHHPASRAIGLVPMCQIAQQLLEQVLDSSYVLHGVS